MEEVNEEMRLKIWKDLHINFPTVRSLQKAIIGIRRYIVLPRADYTLAAYNLNKELYDNCDVFIESISKLIKLLDYLDKKLGV